MLTCLLVATACAPAAAPVPDDDRLHVVATFTVLADVVARVAGPDVRVTSVTKPGAEIHGYEPTPDDLRRSAGADLLVTNGLGLEAWIERLVEPLGLPVLVATRDVEPIHVPGTDVVNPHAWMSPDEGRTYVRTIRDALADLDPGGSAGYHRRAAALDAELADLARLLRDRLAQVPAEHRLLVTCEGAFSYLARDGGLREAYLWPVNAERQGTPRQVAAVIRTVRDSGTPAVFCESTVAPTAQLQVARETGARLAGTLHVDSLTGADGPAPTYPALVEHAVVTIADGLGAS